MSSIAFSPPKYLPVYAGRQTNIILSDSVGTDGLKDVSYDHMIMRDAGENDVRLSEREGFYHG